MAVAPSDRAPGAWGFLREMAGYARPYWLKDALCGLAVVVRAAFMLALPLFYTQK